MTTQPPRGQVIGVATRLRNVISRNAVLTLQIAQVGGIELHSSYVISAVGISHPLAWFAAFFFCHGENQVRGHLVLDGGRNGTNDALLHLWWQIKKWHMSYLTSELCRTYRQSCHPSHYHFRTG
ncbi:hypothetical protein D3C84_1005420 [compost metagenome]